MTTPKEIMSKFTPDGGAPEYFQPGAIVHDPGLGAFITVAAVRGRVPGHGWVVRNTKGELCLISGSPPGCSIKLL